MERGENEWDLVIKVKYGDTLRRFGAYVHGRSMDHNMSKLRAKIISLFKFSPDADLILTYIDEDGDVVTLDDDNELNDAAISQRLNPLRINVQLKTCGSSDPKSQTASSTHTGLQQIETRPPQVSSAVDDALKSVPEPFRGALSKLSHDLVLKAASSAPALADFVENFSKFGLSNVSLPFHGSIGESWGTSSGPSTNLMDLSVSDEPKAASDPVPATIVLATTNSGNPVPSHIPKEDGSVNMTQGPGATTPTSVDLNLDPPRIPHESEFPSVNDLLSFTCTTNNSVEPEKEGGDTTHDGKSVATLSILPADQFVEHNPRNFAAPQVHNSQFDVHYKGVPTPELPVPRLYFPHSYHGTFHRGVQCDGCGMYPITGPRFKSNVKEDYDLCSFCFSEMGNEADYTRIGRAPYHSPTLLKEFYNPHSRYGIPSSHPFYGYGMGPSRAKLESSSRAKLESRFIKDVTVVDGTVIPPCTPFTKIWRMHNNGTIAWPSGTQLLWIGGYQLGNWGSAQLEILMNGCPADEEIDIAVDFTSPSKLGSYISYWRLASPSGRTFGQQVWVQIQVENPQPNSAAGSFHGDLNLNLPPESSGRNGLGIIGVNAEPLYGAWPKPNFTNSEPESLVNAIRSTSVEPVTADNLVGASNGLAQLVPKVVPSVSYPTGHFTELSSNATPVADVPPSGPAIDDNPVELSLLMELEEMGFKQIDLNKEVLRLNEYDMDQSVDDLCGFAERDPLLAELLEMGFHDEELNKKLLVKNGGSIKRVVLDLIAGEKDE